MKIIYHLGLHCTDDDWLVTSLRRNADRLTPEGILVPDPDGYRPLLRETMHAARGQGVSHDTQESLLDAVMEADAADRLVFSNQDFLCKPQRVLGEGVLYPMAEKKARWMVGLFPDHPVEFHFAIRNPATFLPALFEEQKDAGYERFIEGISPHKLRWSEMVARIRRALPKVPLTIWCDEDRPLIWPEVLRAVAGHAPETMLEGTLDILAPIMSTEGMTRLTEYLRGHPPQTPGQQHRIVAAFLDKYAQEDQIEMELDLPGWDAEYVETLTQIYDHDVVRIADMKGVTFLTP